MRRAKKLDTSAVAKGAAIGVAATVAAIFSATAAGLATAALLLAIGIIAAAAAAGPQASLAATVITSLGYTLFLTEPYLSLRLTARDMLPIFGFSVCAIIVGALSARMRDQTRAARISRAEALTLLVISQELQTAVGTEEVIEKLKTVAFHRFGVEAQVFLVRGDQLVDMGAAVGAPSTAASRTLAEESWRLGAASRKGNSATALLLQSATEPLGVLVIESRDRSITIEPALAAGLANLLSLALERSGLTEASAEARAQSKVEELRGAVLSSLSHDFRTPLTTIAASATSMLRFDADLSPETRRRLLQSIVDEGDRLNRYTANLLELSKLQAGAPIDTAEVIDVVEIVGAVLQRIPSRLGRRVVRHHLPASPALVRTDPALLELVLLNVFDNAIIYSEDGTEIEITVREQEGEVAVDIRDEGCGIPESDLQKVFERFHRVKRPEPRPRGSGLGLPIAKAFVEAFGGRIWVAMPGLKGRGTHVAIRLPIAQVVK